MGSQHGAKGQEDHRIDLQTAGKGRGMGGMNQSEEGRTVPSHGGTSALTATY